MYYSTISNYSQSVSLQSDIVGAVLHLLHFTHYRVFVCIVKTLDTIDNVKYCEMYIILRKKLPGEAVKL